MVISSTVMPTAQDAIPDRPEDISASVAEAHAVNGNRMKPPFPSNTREAMFGMGCFWGAEKYFWSLNGVYSTQVGYAGGFTRNATYKDVCTGNTGHAEVVRVIYDPDVITYGTLLEAFWEGHNPTQGMSQDIDVGTQYRSVIGYYGDEQKAEAEQSRLAYQEALTAQGHAAITTEIVPAGTFFYAEDYHQQYLHKNPDGYCGHGGLCVRLPKKK